MLKEKKFNLCEKINFFVSFTLGEDTFVRKRKEK